MDYKDLLLDAINEICLHCGKYTEEYNGACDGCKWYEAKYD